MGDALLRVYKLVRLFIHVVHAYSDIPSSLEELSSATLSSLTEDVRSMLMSDSVKKLITKFN